MSKRGRPRKSGIDGEGFMAVIEKHGDNVTLELLLDLVRVLGMRLTVEVIDRGGEEA